MSLSDREQQILSQIESQLASEDPRFARTVGTLPKSSGQIKLRYGIIGFLLGVVMLLAIVVHIAWAFLGFVLMLVSAITVLNQFKHLGEDRARDLGGQLKGGFSRYMEGRRSEEES
jgi:type VI protein secretion system component VasF